MSAKILPIATEVKMGSELVRNSRRAMSIRREIWRRQEEGLEKPSWGAGGRRTLLT